MVDKYEYSSPLNLVHWLKENDHLLKPPVGNKQIWPGTDYMVTIVGGPNQRTDFHDDPVEEFFYQLKGNASLIIWDRGQYERVHLKEGDVWLMPPHVAHSPQRPEPDSRCLVIEKMRPQDKRDAVQWSCAHCGTLIKRYETHLDSIVHDLPPIYDQFYATTDEERTCPNCGHVHPGKEWQAWHETLKREFNV